MKGLKALDHSGRDQLLKNILSKTRPMTSATAPILHSFAAKKKREREREREGASWGRAGRAVGVDSRRRRRSGPGQDQTCKRSSTPAPPDRLSFRSCGDRDQINWLLIIDQYWLLIDYWSILIIDRLLINYRSIVDWWLTTFTMMQSVVTRQLFHATLSNLYSRNFGEKKEQGGFHFTFRSKILWSKLPHKRVAPENEMIALFPYNR